MNQNGSVARNHIILIGFMGCGKSTVGRELHQQLGYAFVDTDIAIEKDAGKSITTIFAEEGEASFRDRESAYLEYCEKELQTPSIISTGGGAILREKNRELIRRMGYVVWLRADAVMIYLRTRKNRTRPILQQPNPQQIIADLLTQRSPLYRECAHLVIDVAGLTRQEIAIGIIESASYHFTQNLT